MSWAVPTQVLGSRTLLISKLCNIPCMENEQEQVLGSRALLNLT
jgi:hypothetical protein